VDGRDKLEGGHISIDIRLQFSYKGKSRSSRGRDLETHQIAERVRYLRAGLVTPLPGGPGIVPAGIKTGARGAPLKRDWRRG
jgi:hypothetical protein